MKELLGFSRRLQALKQRSYGADIEVARAAQREDLILSKPEFTAVLALELLAEYWRDLFMSGQLTDSIVSELKRRDHFVSRSPAFKSARPKINQLVKLVKNA